MARLRLLNLSRTFAALLFLAPAASAQHFDVATVKQSEPPPGDRIDMNLGRIANGRLTLGNATLGDCLKFAYGLYSDAQLVGPDWIRSKEFLYDVVAQTPPGATRDQDLAMLRSLLTERMKISLHSERRAMSYLALVTATEGPKMRLAEPDAAPAGPAVPGRIVSHGMLMHTLALLLARFEKNTVLDETGLAGSFDVDLQWSPNASVDEDRPSLYTALRKQLGLKLEARRGPVEVLVVDSADRVPAAN